MSRLRTILDRMNDIEATVARLEGQASEESAFAYQLSLQSLENRREMLREELADATRHEFVEICDYRIIPGGQESYALSAVTSALQNFQELVTVVYDAIMTKPKKRLTKDPDIIEKTRFGFGFSYSGSLGIALVIENERLLAIESDLDKAIDAVFKLIKAGNIQNIHEAAEKFGSPAVRKLYALSKVHRDYDMSAEIKWIRDSETRNVVFAQPQEFTELCQVIETRGEESVEEISLTGTLATWDTIGRRFILVFPDADPVRGNFSKDFNALLPRTVQNRYKARVLRRTKFNYVSDQEDVSWELLGIDELK